MIRTGHDISEIQPFVYVYMNVWDLFKMSPLSNLLINLFDYYLVPKTYIFDMNVRPRT